MAKREWGAKRLCTGCGARYYDLNRNPITCPSCGEVHTPETAMKSRRPATTKQRAKPKVAAVVANTTKGAAALKVISDNKVSALDDSDDIDDDDAVDVDVDVDDDDEDGGDVIEDASELGEDEDDMAEVLEGSREAKDD